MRFLNELEDKVLGNTRIIRRGDAHRHPYGGGETGYIKIKLPVSFNDTTQVHKIVINTTQFSDEIRVCGCNTPSYGWVETSAKAKFRVRLGSDSGYGCILIGEASSVWDYAFVYLKESILYGSGRSDADWANPCEVSITSDISSITDISECPPENILAVDIDDYHPATIEGDCPALLLHAVGRTGGIAMDVFKAEVTNSEGTSALFGKIGFFGDSFGSGGSGGGSGDPSVSYMYMGAGIDTAWDNALFKISPSGVGIGLPSADGPEEKLHVSGRIRSDSILLDNGVHQTTIGQLSTEEHNNYFKFITSAANGFFFQGTVNTSGEVYVNWGGNKVWHNGDFDIADYLAKDNTTEYTPTEDYHPATKKFVQDNATGAVYGEYEPVGTVKQFVGTVAPDNYIFGLGQELNRVEYAELFAVIGTTFGAGNGTTTFNAQTSADIRR
jgi:hypothetical protein